MPTSQVTIPELPEATVLPAAGLLVVEDAGVTKKMSTSLLASEDELNLHIADPTDAHDASAISAAPSALLPGTDVQAQLNQAAGAINTDVAALGAHLADTVDAHDASAISFIPVGTVAATNVQAAIAEVAAEVSGAVSSVNGEVGVVTLNASEIPFTPVGTVAATTVQAAILEVANDAAATGAVASVNGETGAVTLDASEIPFTPSGTVAATTVQAAILEVASEAAAGGGAVASVNGETGAVNLVASEIPFTPVGSIAATTVQAAVAEVATEAVLADFTSTTRGAVPNPGGVGATSYLNATGAWSVPAGGAAATADKPTGFANRFDTTDAFGPPPAWDLPVVTSTPDFQEYSTTTISGGVLHDIKRVGAVGTALDVANDPKFRYLGIPSDLVVPGIPSYPNYFVQMPYKPGGDAQFARWYWQVEWETNSQEIEIRCKNVGVGTEFALKINDRWYTETLVPNTHSTNNRYVVKLVFPDARWRRIEYRGTGDVGFGGIWTTATASVRKPLRVPNRRVCFIGDSITNGSNIAPTGGRGNLETVAPRLAHLMDIDEAMLLGIGGTGWTVGPTNTQFLARINIALAAGVNTFVILGSSNDQPTAAATVSAAVTAAMAVIPVTAEVYVAGSHLSTHTALNSTIRLAVEAAGRTFIDYGILDPSDRTVVGTDSIHPTFEGHKRLAQRLTEVLTGNRQMEYPKPYIVLTEGAPIPAGTAPGTLVVYTPA